MHLNVADHYRHHHEKKSVRSAHRPNYKGYKQLPLIIRREREKYKPNMHFDCVDPVIQNCKTKEG